MRKIINRIGEKFGRLTVLKIKRENKCTYYYCKCDCGNELWVRSDCLVSGNTKSCGCLSKENKFETKNIQYKKFNKLTAIEPTDKRDKNNGSVIWKCKCDCGNVVYVSYGDLVFGKTKSCGCSISEVSKENIKKAYKKNIKNNVVKGTNLAAICRKELIASNTSGIKGVRWDKSKNKWVAEIQFKKKRYFLGRYEDKEDAIQVRKTAEEKLFGNFLKDYNDFLITQADEAIKTYEKVLSGELIRFPAWFWKDINEMQLKGLLIYFFEIKLGWSIEDIKRKLNMHTFHRNRLGGMFEIIFSGSTFKVVDFVYPNRIKRWELAHTSPSYWTKDKLIKAVKSILEKEKWAEEDIKTKSITDLMRKYGLLNNFHNLNLSFFDVINSIYPNKFRPWELRRVSKNYWNIETGKQAVKWLIEEKLKWSKEEVKQSLTTKIFRKYNLGSMLKTLFNNSIYKALNAAYPGEFKYVNFKRKHHKKRF